MKLHQWQLALLTVVHALQPSVPQHRRATVRGAEAVPGDCTSSITVRETKDRGLGVFAPHKGARTYDFDPENRWERPRPGGRARARRR